MVFFYEIRPQIQSVGKMTKTLEFSSTNNGFLALIFGGAEGTKQRAFSLAFKLIT